MSFYASLFPRDPDHCVDVGWDRERHSYFLQVFLGFDENAALLLSAGYDTDEPLPCLYDLVAASWTYVDWREEERVLQQLRDDPAAEEHSYQNQTAAKRLRNETRPELLGLFSTLDIRASAAEPRNHLRSMKPPSAAPR